MQKFSWDKLKSKSLQLAFRWGKAVKDIHFLVLLMYLVQNTHYVPRFCMGFQGCSDWVRSRALLLEMISGTHMQPVKSSVQRVSCLILSSGWCALALLGPSVVK
jgi:hypothetical protein